MSATGSVLLDTSIVVDLFRGKDPSIAPKLNQIEIAYLPVIALGELLFGAYHLRNQPKHLRQTNEFLTSCVLLETSKHTADIYGQIKADLKRRGNMIPENDIWIAAMALERNLPLAARDIHFSFITGLTVLQW